MSVVSGARLIALALIVPGGGCGGSESSSAPPVIVLAPAPSRSLSPTPAPTPVVASNLDVGADEDLALESDDVQQFLDDS